MKKTTTIVIRTQFSCCHRYADAPDMVEYLRNPHRHVFYVEVEMAVTHADRELEFILVKNKLNEYLQSQPFAMEASCEQMADAICLFLNNAYGVQRSIKCCVYEDNENGGCVYYKFEQESR